MLTREQLEKAIEENIEFLDIDSLEQVVNFIGKKQLEQIHKKNVVEFEDKSNNIKK